MSVITYRFEEEKEYAKYYAEKMSDQSAAKIISRGTVLVPEEAYHLSKFFWNMVESSIDDEKLGVELPWDENAEFWNEKIMNSFSAYLESMGYEAIWEEVPRPTMKT